MNRKLLSGTGLILAITLFLAINIISNATFTAWRLDVSENKLYTLSEGTNNILARLEEPLALRFYFSEKLLADYPEMMSYANRVRDMLEEYVARSNGIITLNITDPEPFSETEDQAVAAGLRPLPIGQTGDMAYFGLTAANTTDDEQLIAFFNPQKEITLEYDLTKLIYKLANPKKRVVGVVSTLPLMGSKGENGPASAPWTVISKMQELMEVRDLGTDFFRIDDDVDTLLLIHPKDFSPTTLYALDQFVLHGGNALVLIDPFAEQDRSEPPKDNPMAMPKINSDMPKLLKAWGVSMEDTQIAADREAAIRVSYTGKRGPQQIEYLPWLRLNPGNFNQDDFVTNQLKLINVGTAGILRQAEDATTEFTSLIKTGEVAAPMERDAIMFVRDPAAFLESFESEGKSLVIAARLSGPVSTTFQYGRPITKEGPKGKDEHFIKESEGSVNIVVISDTDILADHFWVQQQNMMGVRVPQAIADNGDFIINTLDHLGGNNDLISLRSRGQYSRPFERVEELQKLAEAEFREQENLLKSRLAETEQKLLELQSSQGDTSGALLTQEQRDEIDNFRDQQLKTRKELRAVQHELQKNIEGLGTKLKFINIGLMPLLIGLAAFGIALLRSRRINA